MAVIWKVLTRKKVINPATAEDTRLSRILNTFDLTALGVGGTLGVGVYVLVGHVAKNTAGPSVVLSFLIAAIASAFAGLCYAEFGSRAPRAGSAYIYSYVCVGEFVAFVIGWNLILEYIIGSASVARTLSSYVDTLVNNTMQNTFIEIAPIDFPPLSRYFDFFAFGISMVLAVALSIGLRQSSLVNNIFTTVNILVVLFVIIAGSFKADVGNWSINPNQNCTNCTHIGNGGFFPFGIEGMIAGASVCFYGFVGFDCIATTGEEVKNPKRAIPISIIISLIIIFLAYFGTSTVVTLMVPYYLQDVNAPVSYAFEHVGWYTAKWIVSIGAIFGLFASLFGAMFPLPRIIYAMANDSLVFRFLGTVNSRFQTPVIGTLLAGLLTGLMAAMFEINQLINMMSIGTLLAYTIVAASILLLRYAKEEETRYMPVQTTSDSDDGENYSNNRAVLSPNEDANSEEQELLDNQQNSSVLGQIFNCGRHKNPTEISALIVAVDVTIYCVMCVFIGLSAIYLKDPITNGEIWAITLTSIVVIFAVILIISISTQPVQNVELSFKVPMVPLIPALSILVNIYLMLMLDVDTWIRFGVWMVIGLPIYYFSVRPYTEAQSKTIGSKNSINRTITMVSATQNGKLNGHSNIAYVDNENLMMKESDVGQDQIKENKKGPAPLPPNKIEQPDSMGIPAEITKLDEILEEASNTINANSIDRKLSVGTVSNVSDVASREESVIAVVHRDNVITPANSNAPPTPIDSNHKSIIDKGETIPNISEFKVDTHLTNNTSKVLPENIAKNEVQTEAPKKDIDLSPSQNTSLVTSLPEDFVNKEENKISTSEQKPTEILSMTPTPPSPVTPLKNDDKLIEHVDIPPPPPLLSPNRGEHNIVPRPTSDNLNSVRLKPLKQRDETQIQIVYEPDDDNLRVGSDKYKSFLESLTGKLQRLPVIPSYIPFIDKAVGFANPKKEDYTKNENVIEESINQKEVIEKLSKIENFLSRNFEGIKKEDAEKKEETHPDDENEEIIDETETTRHNDDTDDDDDRLSQTSNSDYVNHKKRMQNVFRSINLKKSDSFKGSVDESHRTAKSLGSSFLNNDDKAHHRQAMGEIFKLIELKRKDSKK